MLGYCNLATAQLVESKERRALPPNSLLMCTQLSGFSDKPSMAGGWWQRQSWWWRWRLNEPSCTGAGGSEPVHRPTTSTHDLQLPAQKRWERKLHSTPGLHLWLASYLFPLWPSLSTRPCWFWPVFSLQWNVNSSTSVHSFIHSFRFWVRLQDLLTLLNLLQISQVTKSIKVDSEVLRHTVLPPTWWQGGSR